ncbi:MAG: hypothetical protein O3C21_07485 [Verrucomicrobia bacterium]|nr:hypothetical protein [Verrucomicrobiota bacterium]
MSAETLLSSLLPLSGTAAVAPAEWHQAIPNRYSQDTLRVQAEDFILAGALGNLGLQRIREFQEYPPGWGDGTHRAYSPAAFRRLLAFVKRFAFPSAGSPPSVFFTREGGFELEWETGEGETVQVEFAPKRIEVFHAGKGVDTQLTTDDIEKVFILLS